LTSLYTRTGDKGETGLSVGPRVRKSSLRIEALGAVDETNACIGLARAQLSDEPGLDQTLDRIQHLLFDLGADLAAPGEARRIGPVVASELEAVIDGLAGEVEPLRAFILPGGTAAAAALHLARTVCRRAERAVLRLSEGPEQSDDPDALIFLNRLSDLLFAAARCANRRQGDVLWRSGGLG
jgi:cob(I)alamin adenosyltransferase